MVSGGAGAVRLERTGQYGTGGNPEVFGIANQQVYAARFNAGGNLANGWCWIAPGFFAALSAGSHSDGTLELFGFGTNGQVYAAFMSDTGYLGYGWYASSVNRFATPVQTTRPPVGALTGALTGALSSTFVNGIADFANLRVTKAGTYVLTISAGELTTALTVTAVS